MPSPGGFARGNLRSLAHGGEIIRRRQNSIRYPNPKPAVEFDLESSVGSIRELLRVPMPAGETRRKRPSAGRAVPSALFGARSADQNETVPRRVKTAAGPEPVAMAGWLYTWMSGPTFRLLNTA